MKEKPFSAERFPFLNIDLLQSRITWSVRLRWIAIGALTAAALLARYSLRLELKYPAVGFIIATLVILNIAYYLFQKLKPAQNIAWELRFLYIHIFFDLVLLTVLIHLVGGLDNPLYFFYLFHVVISSIVFSPLVSYLFAAMVMFLFSGLVLAEYTGLIPHYNIFRTTLHSDPAAVATVLLVFTITIFVCVYIGTAFMRIYRQAKSNIDQKNRQLMQADAEKTRFFRFTSHELKSPVVAIKSSIDSFIENYRNQVDARGIGLLQRASERADQMLRILKELLELSRSRNPDHEFEREEVELNALLRDVAGEETPVAEAGGVEIDLNLPEQKIIARVHRESIRKVFSNLVGNAVRYGRKGGRVSVELQLESSGRASIRVTDDGIGIAGEDLVKIFDEFYRSAEAKKKVSFGTGLGLSLVKQIVERHDGRIEVESELNRGSCFTVFLPVDGPGN